MLGQGGAMGEENDDKDKALQEIVSWWSKEKGDALSAVAVWWSRLVGAIMLGGAAGKFFSWLLLMAAGIGLFQAGLLDWILVGGNGP